MSQHIGMMKTYLNKNNDNNDINHTFLIYIF